MAVGIVVHNSKKGTITAGVPSNPLVTTSGRPTFSLLSLSNAESNNLNVKPSYSHYRQITKHYIAIWIHYPTSSQCKSMWHVKKTHVIHHQQLITTDNCFDLLYCMQKNKSLCQSNTLVNSNVGKLATFQFPFFTSM